MGADLRVGALLDAIETLLRAHGDAVIAGVDTYQEMMDPQAIAADVKAVLDNQFGDDASRVVMALERLGGRVVAAIALGIAEEQGNPQPLRPVD